MRSNWCYRWDCNERISWNYLVAQFNRKRILSRLFFFYTSTIKLITRWRIMMFSCSKYGMERIAIIYRGNISARYNIFTKIYNTFETWKRGAHLHTGSWRTARSQLSHSSWRSKKYEVSRGRSIECSSHSKRYFVLTRRYFWHCENVGEFKLRRCKFVIATYRDTVIPSWTNNQLFLKKCWIKFRANPRSRSTHSFFANWLLVRDVDSRFMAAPETTCCKLIDVILF